MVLFLALGFNGCASMTVTSDYDTSADFSGLKTYQWKGLSPASVDPKADNAILASRVENAVDLALSPKGFQKVTSGTPDFWVRYGAAIETRMDVQSFDYGPYGPRGGRYGNWDRSRNTTTFYYDQGTLFLDIVDPKTNNLIWLGKASAVIDQAVPSLKTQ